MRTKEEIFRCEVEDTSKAIVEECLEAIDAVIGAHTGHKDHRDESFARALGILRNIRYTAEGLKDRASEGAA